MEVTQRRQAMKINFIDADSVDLAERSVVQIPRDDMLTANSMLLPAGGRDA
jgi:hypothetical protein